MFGDFKNTGKPQLVFWNQGAKSLFIADIPADPRQTEPWPFVPVYAGAAGERGDASGGFKYPEGAAAADIDGDGIVDLLAGNYWFKYEGNGHFRPIKNLLFWLLSRCFAWLLTLAAHCCRLLCVALRCRVDRSPAAGNVHFAAV